MRLITAIVLVGTSAGIAACAANPDPIIDMKGVDQKQFTQDWNECAAYSREVDVAKGAAKGAATGAAVGAVAGAIGGDVGHSAAYGGLYGGTRSALGADREQQMVFKRCMRGRGYRVLN
jgi:outer membrane lipoprotein SlyB